jgi:hypothetical protein
MMIWEAGFGVEFQRWPENMATPFAVARRARHLKSTVSWPVKGAVMVPTVQLATELAAKFAFGTIT